MATKKNETALAVADNFQLMNRYEGIDPELLAELQDEMDDLDPESGITCLKIKIPSGGGLAYEVQTDEEDDAEYMKQIDGVVIFTHRANGFWPGAYGSGEDQNQPPACASMDGKTAIWTDTGELRSCEGCPYNEYGSGADQTGAGPGQGLQKYAPPLPDDERRPEPLPPDGSTYLHQGRQPAAGEDTGRRRPLHRHDPALHPGESHQRQRRRLQQGGHQKGRYPPHSHRRPGHRPAPPGEGAVPERGHHPG
ncbi:MAG: hypothetical protein ACLU9S_16665 [Oscillospiraceae bacterium]